MIQWKSIMGSALHDECCSSSELKGLKSVHWFFLKFIRCENHKLLGIRMQKRGTCNHYCGIHAESNVFDTGQWNHPRDSALHSFYVFFLFSKTSWIGELQSQAHIYERRYSEFCSLRCFFYFIRYSFRKCTFLFDFPMLQC